MVVRGDLEQSWPRKVVEPCESGQMDDGGQVGGQNGDRRRKGYSAGLVVMGLLYITAGGNHFAMPRLYLSIMPAYIPHPLAMVWVSGVAEIAGGVGVLVPDGLVFRHSRRTACWGLIALLIAVFPANLQMALHPELFSSIPAWMLWARLPLQLPLILWAWWYAR